MLKKLNKNYYILLILTIIFIVGIFYIYKKEENNHKKNINTYLDNQKKILEEYFYISKTILYTFKNAVNSNRTKEYILSSNYSKALNIKDTYNIQYLIDNKFNSTLYGIGNNINNISKEHKKEINKILNLDYIFKTALETLPDIKWIYFTSNRKYIFLAPYSFTPTANFIEEQYEKNFWVEAIKKNNPTQDIVLTDLYIDGVSNDLLTTLSLPISDDYNNLVGVISIDIKLDFLDNLFTKKDYLSGNSYLLNHNNSIISSTTNFNKKDKLDIKNKELIIRKVLNDKIVLAYKENPSLKHAIIIKESMSQVLVLLFILSIVYMSYYLTRLVTKIENLANKDALTLLLNRRAIRKESLRLLELAKRQKNDISFLLIDIDNFKQINDTYGHAIGDIVLKSVSSTLVDSLRKTDLVSRYGGEEFLIVLIDTNLENAFLLAEKVREEIHRLNIQKIKNNVSISIGCAQFDLENDCLDSVIQRADKLLYEAKNSGRNKTRY
ncbi:diguanylate cyclase [Arcobacter sp. YIC-464]|uniref:diguanylate cyclase n=1 Tax=Arcobacter sp. YIC-464 TaxID=3376631 RepID=UPI003C20AF9E